jgi:hypothetical protein
LQAILSQTYNPSSNAPTSSTKNFYFWLVWTDISYHTLKKMSWESSTDCQRQYSFTTVLLNRSVRVILENLPVWRVLFHVNGIFPRFEEIYSIFWKMNVFFSHVALVEAIALSAGLCELLVCCMFTTKQKQSMKINWYN